MPLGNPALRDLRGKIEAMENRTKTNSLRWTTDWPAFDQLLPARGFRPGSLVEWLSPTIGCGAMTLAMMAGARAIGANRSSVLIDPNGDFYPPAIARAHDSFQSLFVLRPRNQRELLWTWDQVLRCRGIGMAVGWIHHAHDRLFRRLSLAAEQGQTLGMILRPFSAHREPNWADTRLLVEPRTRTDPPFLHRRTFRLSLLHARGAMAGSSIEVSWDEETFSLSLACGLGRSATIGPTVQAS